GQSTNSEMQEQDLKIQSEPVDLDGAVDPKKSKATFMKNFTSLPVEPSLEPLDKMGNCLVCLDQVNYQFKSFNDFTETPLEYDRVLQVPADEEGHRLSVCGHLIHKDCLKGLQSNRGLPTYKCPKCQEPIPYHELEVGQWMKKYGFSWDVRNQDWIQSLASERVQ
ncbi:MAG: hypothetical protein ABI041_01465, partial [Bdellovibrionia bacterium]